MSKLLHVVSLGVVVRKLMFLAGIAMPIAVGFLANSNSHIGSTSDSSSCSMVHAIKMVGSGAGVGSMKPDVAPADPFGRLEDGWRDPEIVETIKEISKAIAGSEKHLNDGPFQKARGKDELLKNINSIICALLFLAVALVSIHFINPSRLGRY